MITYLDHPKCGRGAIWFYHADALPYWRKRKHLGHRLAKMDAASLEKLADLIRTYFHRNEGRGKHCVVESCRRGELDYFFAYPEDYSQQRPIFQQPFQFGLARLHPLSADPGRADGEFLGLQCGQVKPLGRVVDVKSDHAAGGVQIDVQPVRDLARFRSRSRLKFDIETVSFGIVMKLHGWSFRNLMLSPVTRPGKYLTVADCIRKSPPAAASSGGLKYRLGGKEKRISLGAYPDVSLKEARRRRAQARQLLAREIDPSEHRKAQKAARPER